MFRIARTVLFSLIALGMATAGKAQNPTAPQGTAAPGATPGARGPMIAGANDVVATVTSHNHTSKVTKGEVFTFFSRYPSPPVEERDIAYHIAVENLINPILLNEFNFNKTAWIIK